MSKLAKLIITTGLILGADSSADAFVSNPHITRESEMRRAIDEWSRMNNFVFDFHRSSKDDPATVSTSEDLEVARAVLRAVQGILADIGARLPLTEQQFKFIETMTEKFPEYFPGDKIWPRSAHEMLLNIDLDFQTVKRLVEFARLNGIEPVKEESRGIE